MIYRLIGSTWNDAPERTTLTEAIKRETGRALWESSRFARALKNALRRMKGNNA